MPDDRPIPRPVPLDELPQPEPPPELAPREPSTLRLTTIRDADRVRLAVVYKRTYRFEHRQRMVLADEQLPLQEEAEPHDELEPERTPSWKALPELIARMPGTDLIVQGSARPPSPTAEMTVAVELSGRVVHSALVFGPRRCEVSGGRITFTPPEPFEEMPLRYEYAYGGGDPAFDRDVLEIVRRDVSKDKIRRVTAVAEELFGDGHPLMYPRNRFGSGYVIDPRPEDVEGRELPRMEWPTDRLTPERLAVGNPLDWNKQPLPVGFDYLDPSAFPRSSMLALPPPVTATTETFEEVERGLIPPDFSRGNILTAKPEDLPGILHPWAGRSASLGLWLPFLRGNEALGLVGMDPAHPQLVAQLPGERPSFQVPGMLAQGTLVEPELHAIRMDVPEGLATLVWVGLAPLRQQPRAEDLVNAEAEVVVYQTRD